MNERFAQRDRTSDQAIAVISGRIFQTFSKQAILKAKRFFVQETSDRHFDRSFEGAFQFSGLLQKGSCYVVRQIIKKLINRFWGKMLGGEGVSHDSLGILTLSLLPDFTLSDCTARSAIALFPHKKDRLAIARTAITAAD